MVFPFFLTARELLFPRPDRTSHAQWNAVRACVFCAVDGSILFGIKFDLDFVLFPVTHKRDELFFSNFHYNSD